MGVAAAAIVGGIGIANAVGDAPASAADARPVAAVTSERAKPTAKQPTAKRTPPAAKSLRHDGKLQPNYYYCGPAATRIALSAHAKRAPSHDSLAKQLGTTTAGTNSAEDITRVLNHQLGQGRYHTTELPDEAASPKQVEKLRRDIVTAVSNGDPVVANIAGTVSDTAGEQHSYEGGHYLTVVGYSANGSVAKIADPADTVGGNEYRLSTTTLANWIATRGYSS
jgi:hypothetical protein